MPHPVRMGLVATRNRDVLAEEARQAAADGMPVFITVLHSQTVSGGFGGASGSAVGATQVRAEWARRVAAIEAEGWRLDQWAIDHDQKGNPTAFPVFRRDVQDRR